MTVQSIMLYMALGTVAGITSGMFGIGAISFSKHRIRPVEHSEI